MPTAQQTAQQLVDLSGELTDIAGDITDYVERNTVPTAPTPPELDHLSLIAAQISANAITIGHSAIQALASDLGSAIDSLNFQVGQAGSAIAKIDEAQKVLDIASAVLVAAASVATSAGTGNWIGAASAVVTLATSIHQTLSPSP